VAIDSRRDHGPIRGTTPNDLMAALASLVGGRSFPALLPFAVRCDPGKPRVRPGEVAAVEAAGTSEISLRDDCDPRAVLNLSGDLPPPR
jgi:hypothetical protein